jgi:hypothetical protein
MLHKQIKIYVGHIGSYFIRIVLKNIVVQTELKLTVSLKRKSIL